MPDDFKHENDLLWESADQNAEEVHQLVEELEAAYATIQSLTTLLRLFLERVRISTPDDLPGLKRLADEAETQILQVLKRPDKVN